MEFHHQKITSLQNSMLFQLIKLFNISYRIFVEFLHKKIILWNGEPIKLRIAWGRTLRLITRRKKRGKYPRIYWWLQPFETSVQNHCRRLETLRPATFIQGGDLPLKIPFQSLSNGFSRFSLISRVAVFQAFLKSCQFKD